PRIAVLLTVHNEEKCVRKRLENLASLDYPGPLCFVVVSDGSTDRTDEIVEEFLQKDRRFRLHRTERLGKSGAQNHALANVDDDVVVLADADCMFSADYLSATVRYFSDPRIGCVTGNLILLTAEGNIAPSLGLYWNFERLLRNLESAAGLLA